MSATDVEHRAAEWNVSPAMVERIDRAAADRGVDSELVARGVTEQGLDPEQAAELRQLDTQRMADLAAANGRPPPDPETLAALGKLGGLLGDVVEFLDITYDGTEYVFTVKHPDTGEPAHTRRIDSDALLTLANLQTAIYRATDGVAVQVPARNRDGWRKVHRAIRAARRQVEPDEDPADAWRFRLDRYTDDRLGASSATAIPRGEPFRDHDHHLHVHSPSFGDWLAHQPGLDRDHATPALRDALGFTVVKHQHGPRDRRTRRTYWRSPEPWEPNPWNP